MAKQSPQSFGKSQKDFISRTHFHPQMNRLSRSGINVNRFSPVLRDVVWSTAVQHGANTDVVEKAFKKAGQGASEADIITAIYLERWGGGRRFASSTSAVKNSVQNRFFSRSGELNTALSRLS